MKAFRTSLKALTYKKIWCQSVQHTRNYCKIMEEKNNKKKILKNTTKTEKLTISSLKEFSYSPKKTRSHVKIEYDSNDTSNSKPSSEISSISHSTDKLKNSTEEISLEPKPKTNTDSKNKKSNVHKRKSPKKKEDVILESESKSDLKTTKWEPINWKEILENIRRMRSSSPAPVDTMGCDSCSDENADEKTKRFQILVALMLSSQTKDQTTYEAMKRLKSKNLTPKTILEMDSLSLEQLLNPVSFYKNKAKYLRKTSEILIEKYDSDIPNTVDELIKLPGVGPKMAHICMNSAWNIITGIGVDVHVHRISNRLGWVKKKTKTPEDTRKELESWLPFEYWNDVNHLMVGFGQTICTPINPKCKNCLNCKICPSSSYKSEK